MQITLNDFLRLLNNSDRLRIVKGGETKYVGYLGNFKQDNAELTGAEEVKKFRAVPGSSNVAVLHNTYLTERSRRRESRSTANSK